ncbi:MULTISPECIES: hypothetical protein [Calothrix]|uniref:Uncharacterized protein n=1 Tax=Calothrix anomala FACHB-343 TaxID=2692894 RepID=A0ABR8ASN4_9CYAN|nr:MULTISPECIES: hypothetical protein [Calothrix]MBD2202944.1 hypothetical protein [Calothrix sp. FACHB-168]MBD2216072.1 hypothetical protein [Calothrix sp. FACHB-1219]MBD2224751.1 hypothetical protein [Calothrix anomala FACHB-343]
MTVIFQVKVVITNLTAKLLKLPEYSQKIQPIPLYAHLTLPKYCSWYLKFLLILLIATGVTTSYTSLK